MKTYSQLIHNIVGQLNGVERMLNEEKECFATLNQMKAARSALNALMNRYLSENLQTCLMQCKVKGEREDVCKKFINEILTTNTN